MKSKLVLIADAHIKHLPGKLDIQYTMQVLEEALEYATELKADICFPGDLIDQKPPPLEVLFAIYRWMKKARIRGINVYWVRGNHISPDHANPEKSIILLFQDVCKVINTPAQIETDDWYVAMVPWYPAERIKGVFAAVANSVKNKDKPCYLISHLALKEGETDNGHYVTDALSVEYLRPRLYRRVILGDYHRKQSVKYDHVEYLGIPTPRKHNDQGTFQLHALDLQSGALNVLQLKGFYPSYRTYTVRKETQLTLPGYDPRNNNKIICPSDMTGQLKLLYPDAKVEGSLPVVGLLNRGRLSADLDITDSLSVWGAFSDSKKLDETYRKLGRMYVKGKRLNL